MDVGFCFCGGQYTVRSVCKPVLVRVCVYVNTVVVKTTAEHLEQQLFSLISRVFQLFYM